MPQPDTDRLKAIKSLPQLVAYLRDELDWPIESAEPEEILFDYAPGELGLDAKAAVNIKEIRQLRPLAGNQPWGIFFVNFEKKQLPVSVMRLILRALVFKKRASANKADRQAWQPHDLLFVSSCGTDNNRSISFAHFVENKETELSELRVLGWDDDDTPLHMDYVSRMLHEKLGWDAKLASNPDEWRSRWSEAFLLKHRHTITKADELAEALAELATKLRNRLRTLLKYEDGHGEIRKLQRAFEVGLIHDLNDESFADMFAQTVTYGLFSVAVRRTFPGEGTAVTKDDPANLIFTSPFLKEMLGVFLGLKSRKGKIDFDQLGISDVTDLLNSPDTHMEVVLADFNNKTRGEDPVIHFYEHFLSSYNKKLKVERGVFYTPQPVVSYIVRSVHELLKTEFGLEDGLADITTWGEMLKKYPGLKLPPLTDEPGEKRTISPDEPFVQILDPATGTATFLVEVIDVIHRTLVAKWKEQRLNEAQQCAAWNDYVPKHLLPRLHAFELMMAPYAIAHMKIGLKLAEIGYRFGTEERARIYLTNALEPKVKQLPTIGYAPLAREAKEVNEIKWYKRFTVVIGNPPYAGVSSNEGPWIEKLLRSPLSDGAASYFTFNGAPLDEPNTRWLNDDYVKFLRFAQAEVANSRIGIAGLITNHSWFENPTFRGMRQSTSKTFPQIYLLDLHGNTKKKETAPDGSKDENVFDIQQGVAISLMVSRNVDTAIDHADLFGLRNQKYGELQRNSVGTTHWHSLAPDPALMLWRRFDATNSDEYESFPVITDIFSSGGGDGRGSSWAKGLATTKDHLFISFDQAEALEKIGLLASATASDSKVGETLSLEDTPYFTIANARRAIRKGDWKARVCNVTYRPFDTRFLYWHPELYDVGRGASSKRVMSHLFKPNIALVTSRMTKGESFAHTFVTRFPVEVISMSSKTSNNAFVFPLKIYPDLSSQMGLGFDQAHFRTNLDPAFLRRLAQSFGLNVAKDGLPASLTPEDIFHYAYAVFHSPGYRSRYAEFLKIDFPRLPLTGNLELFRALARLGGELTAMHLLESPKPAQPITEFIGGRNPEVEKVSWSKDTVWIDKEQAIGFKGVREDLWNFYIGGYQVCEKWLKDRKGRKLSKEDITHYQKVVVALSETIRLMKEIDVLIDKHGGWPGAFSKSDEITPDVSERAEAKTEDKPPPIQQSFL